MLITWLRSFFFGAGSKQQAPTPIPEVVVAVKPVEKPKATARAPVMPSSSRCRAEKLKDPNQGFLRKSKQSKMKPEVAAKLPSDGLAATDVHWPEVPNKTPWPPQKPDAQNNTTQP
jgi:hypothetical protein